jgi:hypothetical protein
MNKNKLSTIIDSLRSLNDSQDDVLQEEDVIQICKELQEYQFAITTAKSLFRKLILNKLEKYPPFPNGSLEKDIEQYFNLIGYCMIIDPDSKEFLTEWGIEFPLKNKILLAEDVQGYINLFTRYRDDKLFFEAHWVYLKHEKFEPYFSHVVYQLNTL